MLGDMFIFKHTNLIFQPPMCLTFLTSYLITKWPGVAGGIYLTEENICHMCPIKIADLSISEFYLFIYC